MKDCFCWLNIILIGLTFAFILIIPPLYAQEQPVCLDCHDTKAASLVGSPHQLPDSAMLSSPITVTCQNCHDGWQEHINNPTPENITMGPELPLLKQSEICSRCHLTPHQTAMASTDPHQHSGANCSSCHTIHSNSNPYLLKDDSENYCVTCHNTVASEFEQRSVHPLKSGNIKCIDCHDLSGIVIGREKVGLDWRCQSCHGDLSGPFIHEHPVVYNYLVNGVGCTECHSPHGSPNDRLLKQPGNGTCYQCHSTPPGHFTNHSGLGSKLYCVQCHSDIHGSNVSRLFLDPDLGAKFFPDCYQSGCHTIND